MNRGLGKQQGGAVSMITVIFLAIILTVLTTSFIRLTINEQREAIDNDLTTRAYYAAESGIQDAVIAIKSGVALANKDVCKPEGAGTPGVLSDASSGLDTEYTCQLIDLTPNDFQANLAKYKSEFFRLDAGSEEVKSIRVSWHKKENFSKFAIRNAGETILPTEAQWNDVSGDKFPAMIRLQVISVPSDPSVSVDRNAIQNFVVFLSPTAVGGSGAIGPGLDGTIEDATCNTDDTYACTYRLNGLNSSPLPTDKRDYYVRIQALYTGAFIKIEALNDSSEAVSLLNEQAVVDVTGRAGDVFRRVESRVDLNPNDLWPDYAITSAQDICKDFIITNVADDGGNPDIVDFGDANPVISGSCAGP